MSAKSDRTAGSSTTPPSFNGSFLQRRHLKKILKTVEEYEQQGVSECAIDYKMSKSDARDVAGYLTELGYNVRLKVWYSPRNTVTFKVYWD